MDILAKELKLLKRPAIVHKKDDMRSVLGHKKYLSGIHLSDR
ncbi:MAG: hypothetical protein ACOYN4_21525 [Bacteroidales bacterium]